MFQFVSDSEGCDAVIKMINESVNLKSILQSTACMRVTKCGGVHLCVNNIVSSSGEQPLSCTVSSKESHHCTRH